jgi:hypothetical protein
MNRILIFLCLLGAGLALQGQPLGSEAREDSSRPLLAPSSGKFVGDVKYVTLESFRAGPIDWQRIDTTLTGFQFYNPVWQFGSPQTYTGNTGSAHEGLTFAPMTAPGFDLGMHQFDGYAMANSEVKFYRNNVPLTHLYYVQGAKEEQVFKAMHTQNFGRGLNVGVDYRRISSVGHYSNQETGISNLAAFTWFQSASQRYNLFADVRWDRFEIQENGGVQDDDFFDDTLSLTRNVVPVNLTNATNNQSMRQLRLHQSIDFGKTWKVALTDTTDTSGLSPGLRLGHTITAGNGYYLYQDVEPAIGYYKDVFYNGTATHDSLAYAFIRNDLEFMSSGVKTRNLDTVVYAGSIWRIGAFHESWQLNQIPVSGLELDTVIQNVGVSAGWNNNVLSGKRFLYGIDVNYILSGRNEGDQSGTAFLGYSLGNRWDLKGEVSAQWREPHYNSTIYESNHFSWRNDFGKEFIGKLGLTLTDRKGGGLLSISFYSMDDFVFYDTLARPDVQSDPFTGLIVSASKDIRWKKWRLRNAAWYQSYTSSIITLPEIMLMHSLYFESDLFNQSLYMQAGFDVWYATPFGADGYMPVTGKFYNNGERELEFYPVVDFFLNLRIKRIRIFAKMSHLTQGVFNPGYFNSLHYPMPDRSFRLGLSWMFFD